MTATATTHRITSTRYIITAVIAAAISIGLIVALVLTFTSRGGGSTVSHPAVAVTRAVGSSRYVGTVNSGPDNPSRVDSTLCHDFANATPDSPAAFQLAEAITAQGSC